jgi:hypothetical protein
MSAAREGVLLLSSSLHVATTSCCHPLHTAANPLIIFDNKFNIN